MASSSETCTPPGCVVSARRGAVAGKAGGFCCARFAAGKSASVVARAIPLFIWMLLTSPAARDLSLRVKPARWIARRGRDGVTTAEEARAVKSRAEFLSKYSRSRQKFPAGQPLGQSKCPEHELPPQPQPRNKSDKCASSSVPNSNPRNSETAPPER